jgi:hypothetical protein
MTADELGALPSRAPDRRIVYGSEANHYGELRLPAAAGPHPLVILIHGGCFKAEYATAQYFGAMADALKADGIATWNIEYRRLGEPGSGWPGTYLDVGRAVDTFGRLQVITASISTASLSSATRRAATSRCGPHRGTGSRRRVRYTWRTPFRCVERWTSPGPWT